MITGAFAAFSCWILVILFIIIINNNKNNNNNNNNNKNNNDHHDQGDGYHVIMEDSSIEGSGEELIANTSLVNIIMIMIRIDLMIVVLS